MRSKINDLLDIVGLTLWGVVCDILTYQAAVLFERDQDIRFETYFRSEQIKKDQIIWVSRKMSTSYDFYKFDKEEPGDDWD